MNSRGERICKPPCAGLRGRIRAFVEEPVEQELEVALGRGRCARGGRWPGIGTATGRGGRRAASARWRSPRA
jgi:hypothetical protein